MSLAFKWVPWVSRDAMLAPSGSKSEKVTDHLSKLVVKPRLCVCVSTSTVPLWYLFGWFASAVALGHLDQKKTFSKSTKLPSIQKSQPENSRQKLFKIRSSVT